jgi:hypothetical protein
MTNYCQKSSSILIEVLDKKVFHCQLIIGVLRNIRMLEACYICGRKRRDGAINCHRCGCDCFINWSVVSFWVVFTIILPYWGLFVLLQFKYGMEISIALNAIIFIILCSRFFTYATSAWHAIFPLFTAAVAFALCLYMEANNETIYYWIYIAITVVYIILSIYFMLASEERVEHRIMNYGHYLREAETHLTYTFWRMKLVNKYNTDGSPWPVK